MKLSVYFFLCFILCSCTEKEDSPCDNYIGQNAKVIGKVAQLKVTGYYVKQKLFGKEKKLEYVVHYDGRGHLIDPKYNSGGIDKYDSKGNLIEIKHADTYGRITYEYDTRNNLIESNCFANENSLEVQDKYKYDLRNNCIEVHYATFYNGARSGVITYKYDPHGYVAEAIDHDYNDNSQQKFIDKYDSIDNSGNWLKKSVFKDGDLCMEIVREIKYY